jgi:acyl dehydratase
VNDEESLIPPETAALVGTVIGRQTATVYTKEFQRWAAAVKDRNPLYFDAEHARAHGYADVIAPPMFLQHVALGVADLEALRPDGGSAAGSSGVLVFPRCPRRMAGGETTTFHAPVYGGDVISTERRVVSIEQKQGRSGAFVLVTTGTTYTNQRDEVVAEATLSIIARP